jgi:hypothetical protein
VKLSIVAVLLFLTPSGVPKLVEITISTVPKETQAVFFNMTSIVWNETILTNPQVEMLRNLATAAFKTTVAPEEEDCTNFRKQKCWTVYGYSHTSYGMITDDDKNTKVQDDPRPFMLGYDLSEVRMISMKEFAQDYDVEAMDMGRCTHHHLRVGCITDIRAHLQDEQQRKQHTTIQWILYAAAKCCGLFISGRVMLIVAFRLISMRMVAWQYHICYIVINTLIYYMTDPEKPTMLGNLAKACLTAEVLMASWYVIATCLLCFASAWCLKKNPALAGKNPSPATIVCWALGCALYSTFYGTYTLMSSGFKTQIITNLATTNKFKAEVIRSALDPEFSVYNREGGWQKGGNRAQGKRQRRFKITRANGKQQWISEKDYEAEQRAQEEGSVESEELMYDDNMNADAVQAIKSGASKRVIGMLGGLGGGLYNRHGGYSLEALRVSTAKWLLDDDSTLSLLEQPDARTALSHQSMDSPVVHGNKKEGSTVKTVNSDVVKRDAPEPNVAQQNAATAAKVEKEAAYAREQALQKQLEKLQQTVENLQKEKENRYTTPQSRRNRAKQAQVQTREANVQKATSSRFSTAPLLCKIPTPSGDTVFVQAVLEGTIFPRNSKVNFSMHVPSHKGHDEEIPYLVTQGQPTQVPEGTEVYFEFGTARVSAILRNVVSTRSSKFHAYLLCEMSTETWNCYCSDFESSRTPAVASQVLPGDQVCVVTRIYGGNTQNTFGVIESVGIGSIQHTAPVTFQGTDGHGASGATVLVQARGKHQWCKYGYHDGGKENSHNIAVAAEPFVVTLEMF